MSCMPLFRPRTKATELAITIAKWTTGTGIHLHDNVVSHLRLHLAGKNFALLVMILVLYIYIICIYLLYMSCCYASRAQGERQKLTIWTCVPTGLQERICVQKIGWRCKANTHTDTLSAVTIYHKLSQGLFQNMSVESLDLWPMYFQSPTQINLTSPCLDITSSWHLFFLTCPSVDGSFSRNLLLLAFLSWRQTDAKGHRAATIRLAKQQLSCIAKHQNALQHTLYNIYGCHLFPSPWLASGDAEASAILFAKSWWTASALVLAYSWRHPRVQRKIRE